MNNILRGSQAAPALRRLRFLSGTYHRLYSSGEASKAVLYKLFSKITRLVSLLKRLVHGSVIRKTIGISLLLSGMFSTAAIQAQNFSDPQAFPQLSTEGVILPALLDIDADGDLDITGLNGDGNDLRPFLIENIGTPEDFDFPEFVLDGINLEIDPNIERALFFDGGDLDNDGDDDLVTYFYDDELGENYILYYENLGSNEFASVDTLNSVNFITGEFFFSHDLNLVDIDSDGDLDVVGIGTSLEGFSTEEYETVLIEWENIGTSDDAQFANGTVDLNFPAMPYNGVPLNEIADFDNDGDLDVLLAIYDYDIESTLMRYVENTGSGYNDPIDLQLIPSDLTILPTSGDLDNDGDIDILYEVYDYDDTSNLTNLFWLENMQLSSVEEWSYEEGELSLLQTVVDHQLILNVSLQQYTNLNLSIVNAQGAILAQRFESVLQDQLALDVSALVAGVYFLNVSGDNRQKTFKFIKG